MCATRIFHPPWTVEGALLPWLLEGRCSGCVCPRWLPVHFASRPGLKCRGELGLAHVAEPGTHSHLPWSSVCSGHTGVCLEVREHTGSWEDSPRPPQCAAWSRGPW